MQIGPRIRVGGSVGKAAQKLKVGTGKVLSKVAPVAGFINPGLGVAMSGIGDALDTTDGKFDLKKAAVGAITSGVGGKIPGIDKVMNVAGKIPGVDTVKRVGGGIIDRVRDIPGVERAGGAIKDALGSDFAKDMGRAIGATGETLLSPIAKMSPDMLLGGAGMVDAAMARKRAGDLEDQGLGRLRSAYDAKAGLRDMGIKGMSRPEGDINASLADVYQHDAGNPYSLPPVAKLSAAQPVAPRPQVPLPGPTRPVARIPAVTGAGTSAGGGSPTRKQYLK
jgi:hypothetical protein